MTYSEGDVVYAHIPFEDGKGTKPRPVVILKIRTFDDPNRLTIYVCAECYSDKDCPNMNNRGVHIKEDTDEYCCMGLRESSFITPSIKPVLFKMIIEKWGAYSDIEWLKRKLKT